MENCCPKVILSDFIVNPKTVVPTGSRFFCALILPGFQSELIFSPFYAGS